MSRDKQIEEMAVELGVYACKKTPCRNCAVDYNCIWLEKATSLYNAGYRKATEVAREIFGEIEKFMSPYRYPIIADIKKKYIGEDTNVLTNTEDGEKGASIVVNNFGNGEQIKNEGHMTINIGGKK